jgi:diguanylate cyclase (GGDEF)-like protein/PAS domain S-box-containing protein
MCDDQESPLRAPASREPLAADTCPPSAPDASVPPQQLDQAGAASVLAVAEAPIIVCTPESLIQHANAAACQLFGYTAHELAGQPLERLLPTQHRSGHAQLVAGFLHSGERLRSMASRRDVVGLRRDGSLVPLDIAIARFDTAQGPLLVATLRDISQRKRIKEQLLWQAEHDALTTLLNRQGIRVRLGEALQRGQAADRLGVVLVDLDGFKLINDSYGGAFGDRVLAQVGQRLLDVAGHGDLVGRLAGDEFVLIRERLASTDAAMQLARRLASVLRSEFLVDGLPLHLSASIGIAVAAAGLRDADELLRAADTALHDAKRSEPGGCRLFSAVLSDRTRQRMRISQGLHRALINRELTLQVQPIVDTHSGRIVAGELLLRWSPAGGEVAPALFIPIAEATGAILPIGHWVFARACELEARWRQRWGDGSLAYLAVNLSPRQLGNPDLHREFAAMIAAAGAQPRRLQLEITETALMADVEANLDVLRQLAALSMPIAVDDFGTGYSSLAQLTRLPLGVLKLDRAFVAGLDHLPQSRAVAAAIVELGRALELELVAEGVETPSQLAQVRQLGCRLAQGYLLHRPMELERFEQILDQQFAG